MREKGLKSLFPEKTKIMIGSASCGLASGADEVYEIITEELAAAKVKASVIQTGCIGFCQKEPLVDVSIPGYPRLIYQEIFPEKARDLAKAIAAGEILDDWVLGSIEELSSIVTDKKHRYDSIKLEKSRNGFPSLFEIPFYQKQVKIALRNCGFIEPENLAEYIAQGGYYSLEKVLTRMTPKNVIDEISKSGLRGRGGAGYPTGKKWGLCRQAKAEKKFVICNADEGDPGAYMDRSMLEGDPFSILEGMTIGAFAIGASEGYIYVRMEYPLAITRLQNAIAEAEKHALLGDHILESDFSFRIKLVKGSGAFVCGEETALIASIEGRTGEPRQRPPYPVEKGLWGFPTNINNVETWANVPVIMSKGHKWFSAIGSGQSKGTKVFSVVGKVKNTGLVEIPMGITLEEIIYDIGEGILRDKKFKAVQTGGPSGGCIPLQKINLPVDYEHLSQAGSIMGSGGMVIMDEDTCMVDIAKYFLSFSQHESCGKCTPCREGNKFMYNILSDITRGKGTDGDIELLEELAKTIMDGSLCGLGGTAPNPVLSTIRYFHEEYEKHIYQKRCPAMRCKEIVFTPCKYNCPVCTDVPAFVAYIAQGKNKEAFATIRAHNPLPITCGYICHHPCEDKCKCLDDVAGEAMSIKALKKYIGDIEINRGIRPIPKTRVTRKNKSVAIIGSGPAGLAAAMDLINNGYSATIYEKQSKPGGMIYDAIPHFRLPKKILDIEIGLLKKFGVKIITNTTIGKDLTFDNLFQQGFSAIIVATGTHKTVKLGIPGEDISGVIDGLDFLKKINAGADVTVGKTVGVIGGGNTAIDAARSAWRLGCEKVILIYRRTFQDMPAIRAEIEQGIEEKIDFEFLTTPLEVLSENGSITGIKCIKMKLTDFDLSGRRKPVPVAGSDFIIPVDTVISAIGLEADLSFLPESYDIKTTRRMTINTDPETLVTSNDKIFAAGDVVTGPSTIADSMAQGQRAAESVMRYLEGKPLKKEYQLAQPSKFVEPVKLTPDQYAALKRPKMPRLSVDARRGNFNLVETGYSEEMARNEALRCQRCDLKENFERKAL